MSLSNIPGKWAASFFSTLFMSAIMSLSTGSDVLARSFRLSKLPDGGKNFSCATCHINPRGGGARNPFGKDYQNTGIPAGDKYTLALGQMDSDGDGFTNDQEFAAGSNPGDPASKP
ncbi:MAG: thrombospondin type 3 repeat-containing protein [Thermodesulfobacteriota bacterium]